MCFVGRKVGRSDVEERVGHVGKTHLSAMWQSDAASNGTERTQRRCAILELQLNQLEETARHEIEMGKQELTNQLADIKAAVVTVRNLALFLLALLVITVGLFSWLAILMARG